MEAAAAFLAVRSRSVEETRRRLRHLGYPVGLCDTVIERLVETGYLDDEAFARAWVESRDRARPRGVTALRRELQHKGVPEATIAAVLAARSRAGPDGASAGGFEDPAGASAGSFEDPDRLAAQRLLDRRAAALRRESDARKRRQKAYALLARNGFPPDICAELAATIDASDPMTTDGRV